jgi:CubicO group peptidase (beta-lactamase class C family)
MKFTKRSLAFLFLILVVFSACKKAEVVAITNKSELDKLVDSEFKRLEMPGVACAAIKNDSIVYLGLKGYANRQEKIPFGKQTRMVVASVSKTVTATAVMQLYEQGLINLDQDINTYLPFQVRNPNYSDIEITVRMLLTHTSSISDVNYQPSIYYLFAYVDYPETLMDFEQNYLSSSGSHYNKKNFSKNEPGKMYEYSNIGASLIACLVEHVSKTSFNDYCKMNIFEPLGMNNTTWFFSETPQNELAIPYADNAIQNPSKPFYSYPTYPDGHLMTTIDDFSKFTIAYLMNGKYKGFQLLKEETITTILNENISISAGKQGLMFYEHKQGQFDLWGHNGGDPGISTEMYFDRDKKVGYIMFNNRTGAYSSTLANALLLYANQF